MKIFIVASLVLFSQFLFGQSVEISGKYDKIGTFDRDVAFVQKNGFTGLINSKGKEIIKPEYDKINSFGKDNVALSWKKNLVGLIDINGKVIIDNIYDNIGSFKNDQAIVKKNDFSGVVDKTGKIIIDVKYKKIIFEKNDIIKAINTDGTEVLIKPNSK